MPYRRLALTALAWLATACGEPEIIERTATLVSPHGPEGAAVFEVAGEGIQSIRTDGGELFLNRVGGTARAVVVREEPGTIVLRFMIAENLPPPVVTPIEVAGGDDALRPLADYRVEVR